MHETVRVPFLYALGQDVRWAKRPDVCWRVIERHYYEGVVSRYILYRLRAANDTEAAMAYQPDVTPAEDHT